MQQVYVFFFFQAEDGIRDVAVTGVQTCALPISRCRNSIGFSSVTMCLFCDWLMWFTMAAMVELFPEPVTPVTRIIPASAAATLARIGGNLRESNVGTSNGITRITIMNEGRCRRMFTRNPPTPGMPQEQS